MSAQVLIVDDNPTNLKLASDVLESDGFTIYRATDAEQALAVLERVLPELILMDIALPGMDGLTLTRKLKADPKLKQVPIVALTAFAMKGDDQRAIDAGCVGYITKPIDTRRFAQQVLGFLGSGRGERDSQLKVLVIEDNPIDFKLVQAVLQASDIQIAGRIAAEGALQAIRSDPPDVILLDLQLPGANGLTLVQELRGQADTRGIPIVAITAYPAQYPPVDVIAAGCTACLIKPLNTRELATQLHEAAAKGPWQRF